MAWGYEEKLNELVGNRPASQRLRLNHRTGTGDDTKYLLGGVHGRGAGEAQGLQGAPSVHVPLRVGGGGEAGGGDGRRGTLAAMHRGGRRAAFVVSSPGLSMCAAFFRCPKSAPLRLLTGDLPVPANVRVVRLEEDDLVVVPRRLVWFAQVAVQVCLGSGRGPARSPRPPCGARQAWRSCSPVGSTPLGRSGRERRACQ